MINIIPLQDVYCADMIIAFCEGRAYVLKNRYVYPKLKSLPKNKKPELIIGYYNTHKKNIIKKLKFRENIADGEI